MSLVKSRARFCLYPLEAAWLLLCLAGLTFTQRTAVQSLSGTIDDTNYGRFSLVLTAFAILALHLNRVPRFRLNPISVFLVYVTVGVCSSVWSAGPIVTLGKSLELLSAVLVVWITMARIDAESRLRRLVYLTILEGVAALFYVALGNLFDPTDFHDYITIGHSLFPYSWSSPQIHANSVAQLGALVGLFCLAQAVCHRRRFSSSLFAFFYLISAAFPVLAQGRTGMISFVIGSSLILARRFPVTSILVVPIIAASASIVLGDALLILFRRGEDQEMLFSLSGRTNLWEQGLGTFFNHPWLGAGWGVASRVIFREASTDSAGFLHNGVLEVLLGVGLVGFLIWVWAVIWSWRLAAAAYLRGDPPLPLIIGIVVSTTATFLSTGVGGWLDFFVQYFLASTALVTLRRQWRRKAAAARVTQTVIAAAVRNAHGA